MRTTLRLDPEITATAERLCRERYIGLGEVANELARVDLIQKRKPTRFRQRTAGVGLRIDTTSIVGTLELLN